MGLSFYGYESYFRSTTPPVRKMNYIEMKNAIFDEVHVRSRVDIGMENKKEPWQIDTLALFDFADGSLEGGNVQNSNLKIIKFAIKRRNVGEINAFTLGYKDFVNNTRFEWLDITQPHDEFIYSITPIGENNIEGLPNEVTASSDFTGWWIVDKTANTTLSFDKAIGSVGNVDTQLNQGRVVLETLNKYPQVYYTNKEYTTFSLSTVLIPSEFDRSGKEYKKVLQMFVQKHIPMIVKSGDGRIFVCDVSNLRTSQPLNVWNGFDYLEITLDLLEIDDYDNFMNS
jgi:hypothetical protein